eukprot:6086090-Ditylum_brightwellii.AAC.1
MSMNKFDIDDSEDELDDQPTETLTEEKWWRWKPDWKGLFPDKTFKTSINAQTGEEICDPHPVEDLIDIDMSHVLQTIEQYNNDNSN